MLVFDEKSFSLLNGRSSTDVWICQGKVNELNHEVRRMTTAVAVLVAVSAASKATCRAVHDIAWPAATIALSCAF